MMRFLLIVPVYLSCVGCNTVELDYREDEKMEEKS